MFFTGSFSGWRDIGAMHVMFVETHNEDGELATYSGVLVRSRIKNSGEPDLLLTPGDKRTNPRHPVGNNPGLCERTLYGRDTVYLFRAETVDGGVLSDWVTCDLALPIETPGGGFIHKAGYVVFRAGEPVPPVPPEPPDCPDCARKDALLRLALEIVHQSEQALQGIAAALESLEIEIAREVGP